MKITDKIAIGIIGLLALFFFTISCSDMNDIQSKFADLAEETYLGKVDSIKSFPGNGRAKITWYIGSDPKIEQTIIYWNMRKDSIVKDFVRAKPGVQKDSIIVENLPEGTRQYEFRNINSLGQTSLYTKASVTAWGESFLRRLTPRIVKSQEFDYATSKFKLVLSNTFKGDSIIYSVMRFTDTQGVAKSIRIPRDTTKLVLSDFPDGGEIQFGTVFFLPQGIDTIRSAYQIIKAPKVIFETGEKLSIGEGLASKYFDRDGVSLYEWNSAGDVKVYEKNGDGTFKQPVVYPLLLPRTSFRDFFFYDDDKFISVGTGNAVNMHQWVDGTLPYVKAGLGTGFNQLAFIPAKGFFYSVETNGTLKTWLANNNGTWGSPNGTAVYTTFLYKAFALYKFNYLIAVDAQGVLWSAPISTAGYPGSLNKIGTGWDRFLRLVTVGDLLLAMDANGDFWKFNFDTDKYWIVQ